MDNLRYIKDFYADPTIQDDIHEDALTLFAMNLTSTFERFNDRKMTYEEVESWVEKFNYKMLRENTLEEYNQTS